MAEKKEDKKEEKKKKRKMTSAEKRTKQAEKRRVRNKSVKSNLRTATRQVSQAVEKGNVEAAKAALVVAIPTLQKAASKGVIHKRTASRKVSRLTRSINKLTAPVPAASESAAG